MEKIISVGDIVAKIEFTYQRAHQTAELRELANKIRDIADKKQFKDNKEEKDFIFEFIDSLHPMTVRLKPVLESVTFLSNKYKKKALTVTAYELKLIQKAIDEIPSIDVTKNDEEGDVPKNAVKYLLNLIFEY